VCKAVCIDQSRSALTLCTGWSEKLATKTKSSNLAHFPVAGSKRRSSACLSLQPAHRRRARCASWTRFMIDSRARILSDLMVGCAARLDRERARFAEIFDTSQNSGLDRRRRLCSSGFHSPLSTEETCVDPLECTRCARSFGVHTRFAATDRSPRLLQTMSGHPAPLLSCSSFPHTR
jgi:hypothetical protein